jgi:hypothetical protein
MNTLRDPFRELVRRPGVAAMSVLTVALASGAVLTLLALLDFLVLRPLPVRAPEQLAAVTGLDEGGRQTSLPFSMRSHLAESRDGVIGVAGYTGTGVVTVTIGTTMVSAGLDAVTDTPTNTKDTRKRRTHEARFSDPVAQRDPMENLRASFVSS